MRSQNSAVSLQQKEYKGHDTRLQIAAIFMLSITLVITVRLFFLMIVQHDLYTALAAGSHTLYAQLFPERGGVYIQDSRTGEEFPIALNKEVFTVFVDTRELESEDDAEHVAEGLSEIFSYDDEQKLALFYKINGTDDPYEPIEKVVEEAVADRLKEKDLPGVGFVRQPRRFYPEEKLAAQTIGFVGKDEEGNDIGRYGIEGYWNEELAGSGGFLEARRSLAGGVIPLASKSFKPAVDGADILLTIDRTLQYTACERLREAMERYGASGASLVIMDPHTGAVRAMCSLPDFDPNSYSQVEDVRAYNNSNIFTPYEPGSIFKPFTMAAALNEERVTPDSYFYDSGSREAHCTKPITNADGKKYEDQTMAGVLENSINTGMVYVVEQVGKMPFISYLEKFGFGVKSGIQLSSETTGTIDTLYQNKDERIDCYTATAAFGQGITATPLQIISAFGSIANEGKMMKPYIVEEVRYASGKVDRTLPEVSAEMLSSKAASLLSAMLVRVIDSGQASLAQVPGYYVAGKTGTAQIAGRGGYTDDTNHSFIGFAPVDDPAFIMLIKFEKPELRFSSMTAAPTFGHISSFILDYYQIAPAR